ncbi:MAG: GGDEF domain-containing protein [Faecalibacterium sp.]|nr:GGDEF domain-containing protein [Faecalibacterium sp.]
MEKRLTIGVLIGNASSPHTVTLMKGIQEAAARLDVNVIFYLGIHTTDYYRYVFTADSGEDNYDYQCNVVYDYAWLGRADALIISYGSLCIFLENNNRQAFLRRFSGIPLVLVEDRDESRQGTSIMTDNYHGMYALAEHLVQKHGYTRFTFLAGPAGNADALERLTAVRDVMQAYHIPFGENRIQYGDYSSCVEAQVETLLRDFPDMQAMMCANDTMAATAYRVCEQHGLAVGKDIAITGFDDDASLAPFLAPPLTTVRQDAYKMGTLALQKAIALCHGEKPEILTDAASLSIRASCGCSPARKHIFPAPLAQNTTPISEYIEKVARILTADIVEPDISEENRGVVEGEIHKILEEYIGLYQAGRLFEVNHTQLAERLEGILEGRFSRSVRTNAMLKSVSAYLKNVIDHLTDSKRISEISGMMNMITELIEAADIKAGRDELLEFQKESWFMPLISRNMIDNIDAERRFYRATLQKLPALKTQSCYLYILENPVRHYYGEAWRCPEKLLLAARYDGRNVEAYEPGKRPAITRENGFAAVCGRYDKYSMCAFPLFSGETQYGMLLTQIDPTRFNLVYLASLQIDVGLEFHEMNKRQKKAQESLEHANRELNEKNEILGFISKYDPMTDCLNRRGFLELAIDYLQERPGQKMRLFFIDLDHLKEINDNFGHHEGDFAICTGARLLQDYFGKQCVIARIGGDEFVVLTAEKRPGKADLPASEVCIHDIHHRAAQFNAESDKPYYVELSLGCKEFISTEDAHIVALLAEADRYLYEAKKDRRQSIRRKDGDAPATKEPCGSV